MPHRRSALRREARALILLGAPMVAHNLAHMGMQFTDTVMAGRLSAVDLAAVAVGGAIFTPIFVFIFGLLMAVSPTVAHLFGAGRYVRIGHYLRQAGWLALLAALLGVLGLYHGGALLRLAGIAPDVVPLAEGYMRAIAWGLPAACLYHVLRFTSEGVSHTRPLLGIAMLGLVLNIPANYVLIYGELGFPRLGAVGCGYASALVMWAMFIAMLLYMRRRDIYRRFRLFARFEWPQPAELRELVVLGLPIGVAIFMEVSLFATTSLLMATLGTVAVAAHQIAVNFSGMMFMVPLGLSMALTVRVGQAAGRGEPGQARFAGWTGIGVCGVFMLASAAFMLLFRRQIAELYTESGEVATLAAGLLVMSAIFQFSDGMQVAGAGALRGLKDTRVPMFMTVLAYWGVGFTLAWGLGIAAGYGPLGVWTGLIGGLSVAALLLNWRFWRLARRSSLRH